MKTPITPKPIGRVALDLTLMVSIVYALTLLVQPAFEASAARADTKYVVSEAHALYRALDRYYERNRSFPNAYASPRLELDTLEPLRRRKYYDGGITGKLSGGRIDAYDSPDDEGLNREFWIEMTLAADPSLRVLVARSDDAPLGRGQWRDGVFVYRDGEVVDE